MRVALARGEVFHDLTVVAELKLAARQQARRVVAVFHDLTVVAELKLGRDGRDGGSGVAVFHDLTVVAELKLLALRLFFFVLRAFSTTSPSWPN